MKTKRKRKEIKKNSELIYQLKLKSENDFILKANYLCNRK